MLLCFHIIKSVFFVNLLSFHFLGKLYNYIGAGMVLGYFLFNVKSWFGLAFLLDFKSLASINFKNFIKILTRNKLHFIFNIQLLHLK